MSTIATEELAVRSIIYNIADSNTLMIKTSATNLRTYEQLNLSNDFSVSADISGIKTLALLTPVGTIKGSNNLLQWYSDDGGQSIVLQYRPNTDADWINTSTRFDIT